MHGASPDDIYLFAYDKTAFFVLFGEPASTQVRAYLVKMPYERRCQTTPEIFLPFPRNGPCYFCDIGRKTAFRFIDVKTDAHDGPVKPAAFDVQRSLGKDAAGLFSAHEYVVHPFYLRIFIGAFFYRKTGCHSRSCCDPYRLFRGKGRTQKDAQIKACASWRKKAPSHTALASGLMRCCKHVPFRQFCGPLFQDVVRGSGLAYHFDRKPVRVVSKILAYAVCAYRIAEISQPVSKLS